MFIFLSKTFHFVSCFVDPCLVEFFVQQNYVRKNNFLFEFLQEKFEWIEEPVDRNVKQGACDEVSFTCKLSHKGKKAKWYIRNAVRHFLFCRTFLSNIFRLPQIFISKEFVKPCNIVVRIIRLFRFYFSMPN